MMGKNRLQSAMALFLAVAISSVFSVPLHAADKIQWACKPESFELFFNLFSEDPSFQRSVLASMVKVTTYSTVDPEIIVKDYTSDELSKTDAYIFPNRQMRSNNNLFVRLNTESIILSGTAEARYGLDDTGYLVVYKFKWSGCWRLIAIDDSSSV